MSEETTDDLRERGPFESQVLTALATLNTRMPALGMKADALEVKVDARLREARPIWEAVLSRLELIDSKLHVLNQDMSEMPGEVNLLK